MIRGAIQDALASLYLGPLLIRANHAYLADMHLRLERGPARFARQIRGCETCIPLKRARSIASIAGI